MAKSYWWLIVSILWTWMELVLPWVKTAPGHSEHGSAFSSVNLKIIMQTANKNWLTRGNHLHYIHGSGPLSGGCMRMRGVKYFLDYMFTRKVQLAMCCSKGE